MAWGCSQSGAGREIAKAADWLSELELLVAEAELAGIDQVRSIQSRRQCLRRRACAACDSVRCGAVRCGTSVLPAPDLIRFAEAHSN